MPSGEKLTKRKPFGYEKQRDVSWHIKTKFNFRKSQFKNENNNSKMRSFAFHAITLAFISKVHWWYRKNILMELKEHPLFSKYLVQFWLFGLQIALINQHNQNWTKYLKYFWTFHQSYQWPSRVRDNKYHFDAYRKQRLTQMSLKSSILPKVFPKLAEKGFSFET